MLNQPEFPGKSTAAASPEGASTARLVWLILEGYALLLLIVAIFAAATAFLLWGILARRPLIALMSLFIGLPLLVTTARAIRSLFFRVPPPEGIPVTPEEAPALHAMVDDVRRRLDAPRVHRIVVSDAFNASAIQIPRFGLFWPRNVIQVGYPLFATLSPEQLRAVIAHELGHLSRGRGRLSVWLYRTRVSWIRLMADLQARGTAPAHAYWLFRWYAPRLYAQSAAAARREELLADGSAAKVAGGRTTAEVLVMLDVGAELFHQTLTRDAFDTVEPEPPPPFATLGPDLWNRIDPDTHRHVEEAPDRDYEADDSHPSLRERLRALGEMAPPIVAPKRTSGDDYLGSRMRSLAEALDAQWRDVAAEARGRHAVTGDSPELFAAEPHIAGP